MQRYTIPCAGVVAVVAQVRMAVADDDMEATPHMQGVTGENGLVVLSTSRVVLGKLHPCFHGVGRLREAQTRGVANEQGVGVVNLQNATSSDLHRATVS